MRATIDAAGRVVVPKALRSQLDLTAGTELDIRVVDDRLELTRPPLEARLQERDGLLVAVPVAAVEPLTDADVRAALEKVRR